MNENIEQIPEYNTFDEMYEEIKQEFCAIYN